MSEGGQSTPSIRQNDGEYKRSAFSLFSDPLLKDDMDKERKSPPYAGTAFSTILILPSFSLKWNFSTMGFVRLNISMKKTLR